MSKVHNGAATMDWMSSQQEHRHYGYVSYDH